jgi:hypothetical protein
MGLASIYSVRVEMSANEKGASLVFELLFQRVL